MSAFIFHLLAIPWGGVLIGLVLWSTLLDREMKHHRVRKEWPMWEIRRGAFTTDPADLTEIGKVVRQKAMVVELALCVWGALGVIGLSIMSSFTN
jgi:hypothetical protein